MDTNTKQVRTATLVTSPEDSGLEAGLKVRVVSDAVEYNESFQPFHLVTVREDKEFLDFEEFPDLFDERVEWEMGVTAWAEVGDLRFEDEVA